MKKENGTKKYGTEEGLGFELPDNQTFRNFEKIYLPVREHRLKRWNSLLKVHRPSSTEKSPKLKRFMRKGVPHKYRPYVWMNITNAQVN
jgi:hypothetical protein